MKKQSRIVSVAISMDDYRELEKIKAKCQFGTSLSDVIRTAIRKYVVDQDELGKEK